MHQLIRSKLNHAQTQMMHHKLEMTLEMNNSKQNNMEMPRHSKEMHQVKVGKLNPILAQVRCKTNLNNTVPLEMCLKPRQNL